MKRKQVVILGGGLALCIGVLLVLYAGSPMGGEIYRASFERKFLTKKVLEEKSVLDLKYNSFYIAGTTKDQIYLGNYSAPFHLLIANANVLADSHHVRLRIRNQKTLKDIKAFKLRIDSPYFLLMNGTMPGLFRGKLGDWLADRFMPYDSAFFVEAVPINSTSLALRSYSLKRKAYELAIETADTPHFEFKYDLLEKQIDGLFCVDGTLHYNREIQKLIYLYAYRNQFVVMDSNLNLLHRYNTVDTFSHAWIKVAQIGPKNYSTLSAPPVLINGSSCVSGKYLYISSCLLARNESVEKFTGSSVIDVYDLTNGSYLSSFYIKNYKNKKMSSFFVFNNKQLMAIFGNHLISYQLIMN